MYIKATIEEYNNITGNDIKLSYIYLNGEGNVIRYNNKYKNKKKEYPRNSTVIICIYQRDTDRDPIEVNLNRNIQDFCDANQYFFVWFYRYMEEVYLENRIDNN